MTDAVVLKLGLDTTEFKTGKSDVDAVAASAKRAELAADGLISGWKRTSDTLGKSRAEVLAYDASQLKLTQSQKASVDAIVATIAAYDKQAAAQAAATAVVNAQAAASAKLAAEQARLAAATQAQVDGWVRQAAVLGKSNVAIIEMEAAQLSLTAAQKAQVAGAVQQITAFQAQAAAADASRQASARLAAEQARLSAEQARQAATTQAQVNAWVSQAAALGKSKTAVMEMQAAELNLTSAQKAQVAGAIKSIEAYEAQAIAAEKTKERVAELSSTMALMVGFVGIEELTRKFIELADETAILSARMKTATETAEEAHQAQKELRDLASETQLAFKPLAEGFIAVGQAVKNLGGTADTTTQIMKALAFAARSEGQSAEDAAHMGETFARALNLGVQGGREFVSLLKQNDEVARALAAGLGVTTQELKRMAQEGLIDPQRLVKALISQMQHLEEEAAKMPHTVSGSFTQLMNEVQRAASGGNANAVGDWIHSIAVGLNEAQKDWGAFGRWFVSEGLAAVTGGLTSNMQLWDAWASKVESASARGRSAVGKIRGDANFANPDALFTGEKAFQAALGQLTQQVNQSNTAEGINARAAQARTVIENIWNNMVKADGEGAKKYASQAKELFAGIEKDRKLALQALAKQGTVSLSVLFGNLDKQAQLEVSAFADLNKVEQAGYKQQLDILESAHTLGLVSERAYIDRRAEIITAGAASELKQIRDTYAATAAELAAVEAARPRDQDEQVIKKTKISELTKTLRDLTVAWGLAELKQGDIARQTEEAQLERQERLRQSLLQIRNAVQDYENGLKDQNEQIAFETSLLDKSEKEQHQLIAAHQADLDLKKQLLPIQRELTELEVIGQGDSALAQAKRAQIEAITAANREQLDIQKQRIGIYDDEAKRIDNLKAAWSGVQDFVNGFVNALQGGWKNALKYMADQFNQLILRLITELVLQKFVLPLFLQVTGAGGGVAGAAQQGFGLLNGIGSMSGGGMGGIGGLGSLLGGSVGVGSAVTGGLTGIFGSSAVGGVAAGVGAEAGAGAAAGFGSAAAGAGGIAGMAGTVAAAIPVIGWAVAAAAAIYAIVQANKKPSPATGQFRIGGKDDPVNQFEDSIAVSSRFGKLGFADQGTQQFSGEAAKAFDNMVKSALDAFEKRMTGADADRLATILQNTTFKAFSGTFTTEDFLGKFGGDILQQIVQAAFGVLDPALADVVAKFHGTSEEVAKFADSLLALHDASKHFSESFKTNIIGALADGTQEAVDKVVAFVSIYQTLGNSIAALGPKLEALDPASITAFVDALGGAQKALASQAFIVANFTTAQQRLDTATLDLHKSFVDLETTFPDLITSIPETHQAFLDLLGSFDLATETGRAAYAALSAVAPAFVAVHGTADAATRSLDKFTDALAGIGSAASQDARKIQGDFDQIHAVWNKFGAQLLAMGVNEIPTSSEAFLNLVNSIDRTSTEGETLYQVMVALAPAIADVNSTVNGLLDSFHQNFDSPEQGIQRQWDTVHNVFRQFGVEIHALGYNSIPTTTRAFHDFVEAAIDAYGATSPFVLELLHLAPTVTDLNQRIAALGDTVRNTSNEIVISVGELGGIGVTVAQTLIDNAKALADASSGDFGSKLTLQLGLIRDAMDKTLATVPSHNPGDLSITNSAGYDTLRQENDRLSTELARFTVLTAQYDAKRAEQLVGLEEWYRDQAKIFGGGHEAQVASLQTQLAFFTNQKAAILAAGRQVPESLQQSIDTYEAQIAALGGNSAALAALKTIFDEKWKAIVDGVATGVDGTIDQLAKLRQAILDYVKSLKLSDLSPLTPAQKLAEAQRQYQDRLSQARSGNVDALGDITKFSDEYLKQLRDFYASAPAYTQAFNRVLDELTDLGTPPGSGAAAGSAHGDTFAALTSALPDGSKMMSQQDAKDMAGAIIEAIQSLATDPDPAVKQAVEKLSRTIESTTRK